MLAVMTLKKNPISRNFRFYVIPKQKILAFKTITLLPRFKQLYGYKMEPVSISLQNCQVYTVGFRGRIPTGLHLVCLQSASS